MYEILEEIERIEKELKEVREEKAQVESDQKHIKNWRIQDWAITIWNELDDTEHALKFDIYDLKEEYERELKKRLNKNS